MIKRRICIIPARGGSKRILISQGGVDRTNVTSRVLDALAETELPAGSELDIIIGPAAPYLDEVRQR